MPIGIYKHQPHSEETKRKISKANKGKKMSKEFKEKMSKIQLGKILTKEHKENISEAMKGQQPKNSLDWIGENSPSWKGDNVGYRALHYWVESRKGKPKVCEHCGATCKERKLTWANIDHKYRRVLEDYISLCYSCHKKYDIKLKSNILF